jgi:hypothetical protein
MGFNSVFKGLITMIRKVMKIAKKLCGNVKTMEKSEGRENREGG